MLEIPDISVRIRRKDPYVPLEGLRCRQVGRTDLPPWAMTMPNPRGSAKTS
jgi:hypothetical protein